MTTNPKIYAHPSFAGLSCMLMPVHPDERALEGWTHVLVPERCESRSQQNHDQSLRQLADDGGMYPGEISRVLRDISWEDECLDALEWIEKWIQTPTARPVRLASTDGTELGWTVETDAPAVTTLPPAPKLPIDIVREELERLRMDLATVTAERDRLMSHSAALARLVKARDWAIEVKRRQPAAIIGSAFDEDESALEWARELLKETT